jgi:hypothetical protein
VNTWLTIALVILALWLVGFFAFPGNRRADTYSTRGSYLAIDWQKVVEIKPISFLLNFLLKRTSKTSQKRRILLFLVSRER